jgi:hypothetical protein
MSPHGERETRVLQETVLRRLFSVSGAEMTLMWPPPLHRGGCMFARAPGDDRTGKAHHRRTPILFRPRASYTYVG